MRPFCLLCTFCKESHLSSVLVFLWLPQRAPCPVLWLVVPELMVEWLKVMGNGVVASPPAPLGFFNTNIFLGTIVCTWNITTLDKHIQLMSALYFAARFHPQSSQGGVLRQRQVSNKLDFLLFVWKCHFSVTVSRRLGLWKTCPAFTLVTKEWKNRP